MLEMASRVEPEMKVVRMTKKERLPTRATPRSAGLDLYSAYQFDLEQGESCVVKTDLCIQVPEGYYARIVERSSWAKEYGVIVCGGVIDEDYRGEVKIILHNLSLSDYRFQPGVKIAQLVCEKVCYPTVREVKDLDETIRGTQGFGSSNEPPEQFLAERLGKRSISE